MLLYRAELIAEYETLEKLFGDNKGNPRHIYYIGKTNKLTDWLKQCHEYNKLCKASATFSNINRNSSAIQSFENTDPYDSDSDEDAYDWNRKSQVSLQKSKDEASRSNKGNIGSINKLEINSSYIPTLNEEFSSPSFTIVENELKDEISQLKNNIKSAEDNLENKLILMEKKMTQMIELISKLSDKSLKVND